MKSDDGTNWLPQASILGIAYKEGTSTTQNGGDWMMLMRNPNVSNRSESLFSTNGGSSFQRAIMPQAPSYWTGVAYGASRYVAVTSVGTQRVAYSSDGTTWTLAPMSTAQNGNWQGIAYGNGVFVSVSFSPTAPMMTSIDGINWTSRVPPVTGVLSGVKFYNGKFHVIVDHGSILVVDML